MLHRKNLRKKSFVPSLELLEDRLAPAVYNVNNPNDILANPPAAVNDMSLRGAINLGNASADADITIDINLAAGATITLVATLALNNNLAVPGANMKTWTINGPGYSDFIVAGGGARGAFRDFLVGANVTANFNSLTISNGAALGVRADTGMGGGILNRGTLNLYQVWLSDNQAGYGGAVFNSGILTAENSWIDTNTALQVGGGLYNEGSGQATIQFGTVVHNNSAQTLGGGIANYGRGAQLTVSDGAVIECNTAGSLGGGIYNSEGTVTVTGATLDSNTSTSSQGGGLYNDGGTSSLTTTSIQTNHADDANGGRGGGIYVRRGTVNVDNCTVAGNTVGVPGGQTGAATHAGAILNVLNGTGFTDAHGADPGAPPNQNEQCWLLENTTYVFSLADFPSLAPGSNFLGVQIAALPGNGSLSDGGNPVLQYQFVSISDIVAGNLVYTPTADQSGTPYDNFSFNVVYYDTMGNGPLAGGSATMKLNVIPISQAPVGTSSAITTGMSTTYTLSASNFGFSDPYNTPASQLLAVIFDSLPTAGTLLFNGNPVTAGEVIQVYDIPNLTYVAPTNQTGNGLDTITFQVQGDCGTANGSADTDPTPKTITINISQATPTVSISDLSGVYTSNPYTASASVTDANGNTAPSLEGVTPTIAYYDANNNLLASAPTQAGTYTAIATFPGSADYTSALSSIITITIGQATPTVYVSDAGGTYDGNAFAAAETITDVNGNTATSLEGVSPTITYYDGNNNQLSDTPTAAGTYTAVASFVGSADYANASATVTFTICPAVLTATADDLAKTYGSANPTLVATVTGFVHGDDSSALSGAPTLSTSATSDSGVGSYAITVALGTLSAANYTFSFTDGTLTVNPAALLVTATAASKTYGTANPSFAYTLSGFVNGDDASVVSGTPDLSTSADSGSGIGSYVINAGAGSLAADNYTFTTADGTLTITPAVLTVTATNLSKTYGDSMPTLVYDIAGYVNGDDATVVSGAPSLSTSAAGTSSVGSYAITVGQGTLAADNYTFSLVDGTLTINPATLTVSADNKMKSYGSANPTLTATITGLVNGDGTIAYSGTPALSTTATASSDAGSYTITSALGSLTAGNYIFSFAPGTLTVNATSAGTETLTSSDADPSDGSSVTFTVAIAGVSGMATPTGSVSFVIDGGTPQSGTLDSSGTATLSLASLGVTVGGTPHSVTASYSGDTDYQGISADLWQAVGYATTTTLTSSAPNPSTYGQAVTFTATVQPALSGLGTPTGSVAFYLGDPADGGTLLNTATLDSSGTATFILGGTAWNASSSTYPVYAKYSNDGTFGDSTGSVAQTVNQATPTLALEADGSVYSGNPYSSATVTLTGVDGSAVSSLDGVAPVLTYYDAGGTALSGAPTSAGSYSVTASFPGSTNYTAASTDPVSFTISQAATATTLALSSTSATAGDTVTLTATVAYTSALAVVRTGTVNFYADGALLGSATVDGSGVASLNVSSLDVGSHEVMARYMGDTNSISSESGSHSLVINNGGDFVWNDANSNGIQDAGESSGVSGVTVNLLDQDGNTVATTTTDSTGHYHFTSITAGTYQLQFIAPDGTQFTPQAQGSEPTLDSDVDASGLTAFFTVSDNPAKLGFDAGLVSA